MSPLVRTFGATLLFVIILVVLLVVPRRSVEPMRQSAIELDQP